MIKTPETAHNVIVKLILTLKISIIFLKNVNMFILGFIFFIQFYELSIILINLFPQ